MGTSTTICVEWSTPLSPCLPPRKLTSGVPAAADVKYSVTKKRSTKQKVSISITYIVRLRYVSVKQTPYVKLLGWL